MPNIKISEQEAVSLATFDITENTVLIPMLYARNFTETPEEDSEGNVISVKRIYTEPENIPGKLFINASKFTEEMANHVVFVDNTYDKSYIMAYELLRQGLNVVIKPITFDNISFIDETHATGNYIKSENAYKFIEESIADGALNEFKDRNIFNIKFITTGGYANCGKTYETDEGDAKTVAYATIRELAADRGDAIALIEFDNYYDSEDSLFDSVQTDYTVNYNDDLFAAAFFPWIHFTTSVGNTQRTEEMPASFGYLLAYATSVKSNANWFAAAGTTRGYIPGLIKPTFEVGESLMHVLQGDPDAGESLNIMINPIYNAGTYGYRIWGNRVVNKTSSVLADRYMNFLNVRMLLCDIKKQIYHTAMRCTFEPNDDIVWINFKTLANSLLDRMKSGRGISWYKWTKEVAEQKATIKATLTIQPIEAVESFDINIILTDEEATIEEAV